MRKRDINEIAELGKEVFGIDATSDALNKWAKDCMDALDKRAGGYDAWLENLPAEPVPGLNDECQHYIRAIGKGGESYSTELCATEALEGLTSNVPSIIANTVLTALEQNGETPMKASCLVMSMVDDSLLELAYER